MSALVCGAGRAQAGVLCQGWGNQPMWGLPRPTVWGVEEGDPTEWGHAQGKFKEPRVTPGGQELSQRPWAQTDTDLPKKLSPKPIPTNFSTYHKTLSHRKPCLPLGRLRAWPPGLPGAVCPCSGQPGGLRGRGWEASVSLRPDGAALDPRQLLRPGCQAPHTTVVRAPLEAGASVQDRSWGRPAWQTGAPGPGKVPLRGPRARSGTHPLSRRKALLLRHTSP